MRVRRGKLIAWCSVTLGACVLLACAVAFRDVAVEQWYLWKLESENFEERWAAAEQLERLNLKAAEDWYISRMNVAERRAALRRLAKIESVRILAMDSRVEAVSEEGQFVVLSSGEHQKVQEGSYFFVYRGEMYIGNVKVEQVFGDLSGARITRTVANNRIQVGDRVSTSAKPPPKP